MYWWRPRSRFKVQGSSARNVPSDEERGETDVFAGYACVGYWALGTWEVWRARKRLKELLEAQLLSLFRALQTSQVINISTYAQLKHEPIVFYNIVKAINAEVNQIFIIVARAQTSPHNYVFALKLRETLLKSLKIITLLKKIVKSKLSCRKTVQ